MRPEKDQSKLDLFSAQDERELNGVIDVSNAQLQKLRMCNMFYGTNRTACMNYIINQDAVYNQLYQYITRKGHNLSVFHW